MRLAQLRAGRAIPRRYRNRRIGEFLKELDMTEGRSTGIPKILQAMKRNGSPKPEFDFDDDHTFFLCRLPVHPQATMPDVPPAAGQVTGQVTGQVEAWIIKVLKACSEPKRSSDIQIIAGIRHRETFQRNYLDRLLSDDLLARTLPDKPTSRLQKYRLTAKGHALNDLLSMKDRT